MKHWRRRAYQIGQTYGFVEGWPTNQEALLFAIKRASRGLPPRQAVIAAHLARQGYQDGAYAFTAHSEHVGYCTGCGELLEAGGNFCGQCGRQARVQLAYSGFAEARPRLTEGHVLKRLLRSGRVHNTSAPNLAVSATTRPGGWRGHTYLIKL